ncbi:MAG: hydrolase [Chloroflexi bacterium]|nr:hydrolase [Chloroflexota bacterium]
MSAYICRTCGVQHAESAEPPQNCIICDDERQYVGWGGQQWTTLDAMRSGGAFENLFLNVQPDLTAIFTRPRMAIGQRALLVQTPNGNFLWDCITYIDDATIERVNALGGIAGISVSHPHFYDCMVEWSHAFDRAPIYLPEVDREWVTRSDPVIQYYEDTIEPWPGLTVIRCGGHFEGSGVLHWPAGASGRGALLTGDTIAVAQDRRWVTFMRSYPNYIPLPGSAIDGIVKALRPYTFEHLYGGWVGTDVLEDAKNAVERSAERYMGWIKRARAD